ncbi:MAG: shikimate kinase [Frankiales bacterium]|nr:shikimate kinase [Frankiales bacterium]
MTTRVLLLGCSGSGRTTVGTAVASRLDWPYLDDDAVLERTAGLDIRSLYLRDGLEGMQAAQARTLNLLLGVPGPLVASIATGVLLDDDGRDRLKAAGHVVWLKASVPTLARRLGKGEGRPWLEGDPVGTLSEWVAERYPLYEQVADQVVDVDVLPVGQVVRVLLEGLPDEVRGS